jgi:hypothetical protein
MDIFTVIKNYAEEIGGTFTNYDNEKGVVVVPLKDNRYQTVLAITEKSNASGKLRLHFTSKVSDSADQADAKDLLVKNSSLDYSKFMIDGDQLKVAASCLVDSSFEDEIKYMLQEVAQLADNYELKITGKDIH